MVEIAVESFILHLSLICQVVIGREFEMGMLTCDMIVERDRQEDYTWLLSILWSLSEDSVLMRFL